jgi:hypothetical protein
MKLLRKINSFLDWCCLISLVRQQSEAGVSRSQMKMSGKAESDVDGRNNEKRSAVSPQDRQLRRDGRASGQSLSLESPHGTSFPLVNPVHALHTGCAPRSEQGMQAPITVSRSMPQVVPTSPGAAVYCGPIAVHIDSCCDSDPRAYRPGARSC